MKTKQEIFDITLRHLRKQGKAAMARYAGQLGDLFEDESAVPRCAYRGDGGTSCAIGCHIPAAIYHNGLEGLRAQDLPMLRAIGLAGNNDLLSNLQDLHDNHLAKKGLQAWEEGMQRLAADFKLVYTPA